MEEQRTLTLDFVKSLMEPSYTLVWTDYNDNLDNHLDIIRKCLDRRNCDCLWEKAGEWYGDAEYEAVHGIMEKLKEECFVFNDFDEHELEGRPWKEYCAICRKHEGLAESKCNEIVARFKQLAGIV